MVERGRILKEANAWESLPRAFTWIQTRTTTTMLLYHYAMFDRREASPPIRRVWGACIKTLLQSGSSPFGESA